jgi:hypothetical protein
MGKGSGGGSGSGYYVRGGHAPSPSLTIGLQQQHSVVPQLQYSHKNSKKNSNNNNTLASPPKGLVNVGNSCYSNAVLQCLLSTALTHALIDPKASAIFRRYSSNPRLLEQGSGSVDSQDNKVTESKQRRKERQDRNMQENCQWLSTELKSITLEYQQAVPPMPTGLQAWLSPPRRAVLDPGSITRHPDRLSTCLRPYQQEDAHEFLRALLSTLVMNGQNKELSSLFDGLLESAVTCLHCRRPSLTRDRYMDLSLDIYGNHIETLQDALQEFTMTETLSGDNKVFCQQCDCKRNATKGLRLATAPSILVVHLKRFACDPFGRLIRLNKLIDFSLRLEIGDYMSRVNKARPPPYELVAVLVHQGQTCDSGHYIAFTRHNGNWYKCNDSQVELVDVSVVMKQQAYILVYEVEEMRSKHGYASPGGGCDSKSCSSSSEQNGADSRPDFMKIFSNSLCGLDDMNLQDFCWDVSTGMCHKSDIVDEPKRRRRKRREPMYRASDGSTFDAHDDLSTLGESTVDTTDSAMPFRRISSSGNLKNIDRSRNKISHSTGRPSQHFFGSTADPEAALPDYKTAKQWAATKAATMSAAAADDNNNNNNTPTVNNSIRSESAPYRSNQLPPRPVATTASTNSDRTSRPSRRSGESDGMEEDAK